MKKSTRLLFEFACAVRLASSSAAKVDGKFSLQRPKMPQRARVLPSSFLWPFLMSIIENTRKRLNSPRFPLNDTSRGGTERPRYTAGASSEFPNMPSAPAHGRGAPPSFPPDFASVSEHMTFDVAPVVRLMSADTT